MEGGERFDEISYHVQLLSNLKFGFTLKNVVYLIQNSDST